MNQSNNPLGAGSVNLQSEQPKRILSQTDVEYSYDTDVQELRSDESSKPIAIVVTITEERTETKVYQYPGLDRTTQEVDEQHRVIFSQRISTQNALETAMMDHESNKPLACVGCGFVISGEGKTVAGLKGTYHEGCHPKANGPGVIVDDGNPPATFVLDDPNGSR